MKKGRREFFEVFRRVPRGESADDVVAEERTGGARRCSPRRQPASGVKPLSRTETAAPSNKVVLTLSRELLVVIAVAEVLAVLGAFVWGHSLGSSSSARVAIGSSQPSDAARTPALNISTPAAPASPYYTLRLKMSSVDRQNAERIAADLCAMGYDAFPLPSPANAASWTVNIGRFAKLPVEGRRCVQEEGQSRDVQESAFSVQLGKSHKLRSAER